MAVNETDGCLLLDSFLEKYYLSTMYSLEFIVGLTGNTVVVFGYIFCLKNWKSGNIYLFNLSLSDLLFLCTLPVLVRSYSSPWAKEIFCHSNRFLLHANMYTSVLFLTFISIDRYLLMKHPFREHLLQRRRTAIIVSVAVWIWVILELLPLIHFLTPIATASNSKCLDYASSGDPAESIIYSMFLTVAGFLIPLCVMCFFYVKMVKFLKNRSDQHNSSLTLEKPLFLVILAVVIFSLLFTPYHIMRNVRLASRIPAWNVSVCTQHIINAVYIITRPIAFLNSAINPVFYFLMGDHFREMLMAKIRQLLNRKRTNMENSNTGKQGTQRATSLG
ncbi:succinate receptor 1 isoform X2 [Dromaius novaehollandiae]|uniref:Succinate receptor 1 n=1 Tax=Dromaius novaehollandiae TaxID=8790 RepID=A0A8C4JAG3_DRONO|nr:succinate receptor 1 [Dromaius novaehollandiae]XP_025952628.1 succinate receptor 1 [Dromaius novaehollandiae]XP_025952629.1 succinate receptor 1 [Dromaius novaehollandiae]